MVPQGPWQKHGYLNTGWMDKMTGPKQQGYGTYADAALVAKAQRKTFPSAKKLKVANNFMDRKRTVILRLKEAVFSSQHATVKDVLTDEPYTA
jgi:hypothetical protein